MTSDSGTSAAARPLLAFLTGVALAAAANGAVSVLMHPLHVDVGFLLDTAQRVLDGERLYVDILEPNPPLVIYLMAIPAGVARLTGADAVTLLRIAVIAMIAASAGAGWWLGRRYLPPNVAGFVAASVACAALVAEPGELGQRDGLMLVLLSPYAFAAGSRRARVAVPLAVAVAVGVAAGVGVALKPFFLLALVAVEIPVLAAGGGARAAVRPEALAAWSVLAAYAAFVVLFQSDYFAIAALAARHYRYFAPIARADLAALGFMIVLVSAWGFVLAWATPSSRPLAPVLFALSLAAVASVVVQGKGFPYHWVPAYLATTALLALAAGVTPAPGRSTLAILPAACVAAGLAYFSWRAYDTADSAWRKLEDYPYYFSTLSSIVEEAAPGEPVYSFWVAPGFPLVTYTSARWGSSFSSHWLLPSMHQRELRGEDVSGISRLELDAIARDLDERRPGLLFIDLAPRYNNLVGFDLLGFLRSDPAVAARLGDYRELTRVGSFLVLARADLPDARPPQRAERAAPAAGTE